MHHTMQSTLPSQREQRMRGKGVASLDKQTNVTETRTDRDRYVVKMDKQMKLHARYN
jgi:hypothetical protein